MNRNAIRAIRILGVLALFALAACTDATAVDDLSLAPTRIAPPCSAPAPLLGTFNPRAPGYIVVFHAGVDAAAETGRLAELYGFTPRHVYGSALLGFSAEMTSGAVAGVRCEESVDYLEYNGFVTIA